MDIQTTKHTAEHLQAIVDTYNDRGQVSTHKDRLICDVINSLCFDAEGMELVMSAINKIYPDYYKKDIALRAKEIAEEHLKGRWVIAYNHHIDSHVIYIEQNTDNMSEAVDLFWETFIVYKCDSVTVWTFKEYPTNYPDEITVIYESQGK